MQRRKKKANACLWNVYNWRPSTTMQLQLVESLLTLFNMCGTCDWLTPKVHAHPKHRCSCRRRSSIRTCLCAAINLLTDTELFHVRSVPRKNVDLELSRRFQNNVRNIP